MMKKYNYENILGAYKDLGVDGKSIVFVESDLSCLGLYSDMDRTPIAEAHFNALRELTGEEGSIVVPTASFSLVNTDIPFDADKTNSERGVFSEYVRLLKGSVRSFHPFGSYTAYGKEAEAICANVSKHSYGPETPMGRMLDRDVLFLSIGLKPQLTCSALHQVEMVVGVPYRYHREYIHPVIRNGVLQKEPFYMFVWYQACAIKKNNKEDLWGKFESYNVVKRVSLGRGNIYSYSMRDFYSFAVKYFNNNMYGLLEEEPGTKPFAETM